MKHIFVTLLLLLAGLSVSAQGEQVPSSPREGDAAPLSSAESADSLHLSPWVYDPQFSTGVTLFSTPWGHRPFTVSPALFSPWGLNAIDVHRGFNASLSAGVMASFGHRNPYRGAAFFTDVTALYALPLGSRWTLAAGSNYTRYMGWGSSQSSVELFGLANCRINPRLDATVFLSHGFGPLEGGRRATCRTPYVPAVSGPCTTVGADLGIKVNENVKFNVGLSFTHEERPFGPPMSPPLRSESQSGR